MNWMICDKVLVDQSEECLKAWLFYIHSVSQNKILNIRNCSDGEMNSSKLFMKRTCSNSKFVISWGKTKTNPSGIDMTDDDVYLCFITDPKNPRPTSFGAMLNALSIV